MADFQTIDTLDLHGKTVLLRADLNVPFQKGVVTDDSRLARLLPTLRDLTKAQARVVIVSHFGRPKNGPDTDNSLKPIAKALEKLWGHPIAFAEDCIGPRAEAAVKVLEKGQILVLENTRFHPEEEKNGEAFTKALAKLGDIFINDAFSSAHRAHASTTGLAHLLPSGAGRLMQEELLALSKALTSPERPLAALVGGSKISSKLDLLENLINKVDVLVLGGGMANTFVAAQGAIIGKSICEPDMYGKAREIMAKAQKRGCHIVLPRDGVVTSSFPKAGTSPNDIKTQVVSLQQVPADQMILDLGPLSVDDIKRNLAPCKTLVWNGPLGAFEFPPFDAATNAVAHYVAERTKQGTLLSVAGGGDTVGALANAGVSQDLSYLSTAGGAFLEWLEGKTLPGVAALKQNNRDGVQPSISRKI